ncbi:MAG: protein kinase [Acidobacteria bacterium]|nr:protein kinase [Acidobacteriota bacterium]
MLREESLILPPESDETSFTTAESIIGRVVYERFLVEREVTGRADTGRFRAYVAKDLKKYCRRIVLKSLDQRPDGLVTDSPSYQHLCTVLADLDHPNIEEMIETGKLFDGRPYSVSKVTRGVRLADIIKDKKRLTVEQTARIIGALTEALAAAHSRNILHCAVNPANVIISDFDASGEKVTLINFGTAWPIDIYDHRTEEIDAADDPIYFAAPETLVKLGHRSRASDVYSMAVLSYRMLVGQVPFRSPGRSPLMAEIAAGEAISPSEMRTDITREADRLIFSGFNFESARRQKDVEDFGSRLLLSLGLLPRYEKTHAHAIDKGPAVVSLDQVESAREPQSDPAENVERRHNRVSHNATAAFSERAITWSLIVLLLAGALSMPLGQIFLNEGTRVSAVGSMAVKGPENNVRHQIRYAIGPSLTAKRPISITSDTPGNLYILEEFSSDDAPFGFRVNYPKSGMTVVEAGRTVKADLADEKELPGVKAFWVVWTAAKNDEIESVRAGMSSGNSTAEDARKLKHFLERNRNVRVEVSRDDTTGQIVLTGSGERIVHRIPVQPDSTLSAQK